jgi:tripartite-type tricarboxylate transporter receptor subunit TctC
VQLVHRIALALSTALVAGAAYAQPYPSKPIRLIVPFPAGGPTDVIGRTAARIVQDALGQPVVVENRAGAGGVIGNDAIAKAAPDGYTIGIGTISTLTVAQHIFATMPYDAIRDVTPISNLVSTTGVLLANPRLPANTVPELIAYAKANPGRVNYASPGVGTIAHLAGEYFAARAGVSLTHVPYKGAAPAIADLLSGAILLSSESSLTAAVPNIKSGKLKAIAVTSRARSPLLPDAPTVAESGLAGFDTSAWFGLVGPGALPRDVVTRLHASIAKGMREKDAIDRLNAIGAEVIADTPEQFARTIREDIDKWGKLVRATGVKAE